MSFRMPAEWAPQERVWMAFPTTGYTLGATTAEADEARSTWAAVAHAVSAFEPVTMVIDPRDRSVAPRYLSREIEIVEAPLDDAWMRDIGPSFVHAADGRVAAVDWVFNGWGQAAWATWAKDARIGAYVAERAGVERIASPMVNEGGGFHVDGEGTVLVTETVQLGEGRNHTWSRAQVEQELARTIGATDVVWLNRGLTRDYGEFGTRGHVDMVATFTAPGQVLLHDQTDPHHPDHEVTRDLAAQLQRFEVVRLPAPATTKDAEGFNDWSYVNHLVVNGGVVACGFDDPRDADAVAILREAYRGREVVTVDARPLFERGGGIHCITQQQPSPL